MTKLSDYAKKSGISYRTAYNHFKKGLIPNAIQKENGSIYIHEILKKDQDLWLNVTEFLKNKGYEICKKGGAV